MRPLQSLLHVYAQSKEIKKLITVSAAVVLLSSHPRESDVIVIVDSRVNWQ